MKKRIVTSILIAALAFGLSFSAFGLPAAASSPTRSQTDSVPAPRFTEEQRAELARLNGLLLENRAAFADQKSQNMVLGNQLRTLLEEFKASGKQLSADDLAALKTLKTDLASKRGQLKTSVGQIKTLMNSLRDYRRAGDYNNMVSVLNQVLAIQQTRITLCTEIGTITQQMIGILQAA